jgi:hypothetical protein
MAMCRCKKHGNTGIEHVCPHVKNAYESNERIDIKSIFDDFYGTFFVCTECAKLFERMIISDDLDEFYDSVEPCCNQCFLEWTGGPGNLLPVQRVQKGRKTGLHARKPGSRRSGEPC